MIKKILALSITLTFATVSGVVHAEGDISAGEAKAASCASCHGEDGNSMVPGYPKLAGQHASYIEKQLHALKENTRNAPMMAPYAMGLDDADIEDIAAYYASKKISANSMPVIESDDDEDEDDEGSQSDNDDSQAELNDLMTLGSDLYRNGDLKRQVSACIACHGPYGEGNKPAAFPTLRRQHADYLIKSLTDFKNGTRNDSSDNMMHMIAKKMTDKEIKAVSYHMSMKK